jgi:hypothetical protein
MHKTTNPKRSLFIAITGRLPRKPTLISTRDKNQSMVIKIACRAAEKREDLPELYMFLGKQTTSLIH